jgi:hypothetical protein
MFRQVRIGRSAAKKSPGPALEERPPRSPGEVDLRPIALFLFLVHKDYPNFRERVGEAH